MSVRGRDRLPQTKPRLRRASEIGGENSVLDGGVLDLSYDGVLSLDYGNGLENTSTTLVVHFLDDEVLPFGDGSDYGVGYNFAADELRIVDGIDLTANIRLKLDSSGHFDFVSGNIDTLGIVNIGGATQSGKLVADDGTRRAYFCDGSQAAGFINALENVELCDGYSAGNFENNGNITYLQAVGIGAGIFGVYADMSSDPTSATAGRFYDGTRSVDFCDGANAITVNSGDSHFGSGTGTFSQIIDSGLTASLGVYTDASKQLTSTPPTTGVLGYWSRAGTVVSTATAGDDITTTGLGTFGTLQTGNVTIGSGAVGIDYTLTFDGEDSDGVMTWNEDESRFEFDNLVRVTDTTDSFGQMLALIKTDYDLSSGNTKYITNFSSRASTVGSKTMYTSFVDTRITANTGTQTGSVAGVFCQVYNSGDADISGEVSGGRYNVWNAGGGTHSSVNGVYANIYNLSPETGTITNAHGLRVYMDAEDGTIVNAYGVYIRNFVKNAGALTKCVGFHCEAQTNGATNYGIVLDGDTIGSGLILGGGQDFHIWFDGSYGRLDATGDPIRIGDDTTNCLEVLSDGDVVFHGTAGLQFGSCYGTEIVWTQASAAQNTWYDISDSDMVSGPLNGVTHDGNGKLTVASAGMYMADWAGAFEASAANVHVQITFSVNGTEANPGMNHFQTVAATREMPCSGNAILDLAASDTVNVSIRTTDAGTPNFTVDHLMIRLVQIGGT